MPRQALGRGLNALIPGHLRDLDAPKDAAASDIAVAEIRPNPYQPRVHFSEAELRDLAASIKEQGVLQPILVVRGAQGGYELVSGERRLRAVQSLGWTHIPAVVKPAAGPRQMAEWAIVENVQRDDLSALEQARAYTRLMDEFKLTTEEVAQKVGRDRATISNTMRLLKLAPELQALLEKGELQMGHARALLAIESPSAQKAIGLKAAREGWSVRAVEQAGRERGPAGRGVRGTARLVVDLDARAVEDRLRRKMGAKVTLKAAGQGGRIEIHYFNAEELERLIDLLG
ncbi:MAG TPA: ParB/RepB/Spo0J family partition protein [bacterium]|jgi:ParB family chromosome partitioning protein|nr:ParB/RepB/Spo0J family partition protein [bacterium]